MCDGGFANRYIARVVRRADDIVTKRLLGKGVVGLSS